MGYYFISFVTFVTYLIERVSEGIIQMFLSLISSHHIIWYNLYGINNMGHIWGEHRFRAKTEKSPIFLKLSGTRYFGRRIRESNQNFWFFSPVKIPITRYFRRNFLRSSLRTSQKCTQYSRYFSKKTVKSRNRYFLGILLSLWNLAQL